MRDSALKRAPELPFATRLGQWVGEELMRDSALKPRGHVGTGLFVPVGEELMRDSALKLDSFPGMKAVNRVGEELMRDSALKLSNCCRLPLSSRTVGEELMRDSALKQTGIHATRVPDAQSEKSSCATAL